MVISNTSSIVINKYIAEYLLSNRLPIPDNFRVVKNHQPLYDDQSNINVDAIFISDDG